MKVLNQYELSFFRYRHKYTDEGNVDSYHLLNYMLKITENNK